MKSRISASYQGGNHERHDPIEAATDCGTGVKEVYYSLDGGAPIVTYSTSAIFNVTSEGVHTPVFYSIDEAGNLEVQRTSSVRIDVTPLAITLNNPADDSQNYINTSVLANYSVTESRIRPCAFGSRKLANLGVRRDSR